MSQVSTPSETSARSETRTHSEIITRSDISGRAPLSEPGRVRDESVQPDPEPASPIKPPGWAARSFLEDGIMVHELVSEVAPAVRVWVPDGWVLVPSTVSLSTVDVRLHGRWGRTPPTIQIEGGSYTFDGIRQLRDAIDGLLARFDEEEPLHVVHLPHAS